MTYIPILTQKDLVLDTNGKIIPNAKIEVLNPISSNPIDVFTYDAQNDRYVAATNPIYLNNESRPEHTYFVTQLAYCRLSKYMGDFMDPLTHSTLARYDFIRDWYGAFTSDDAHNDTLVYGYSGLEQANPELGAVTVIGYWTDKDCEARTYVWDPNCVQDADGGYIVKNPELDTGRWILIFDGEYLPSTYYGVYPGHESTINALLNYVATVGTAQKPTAPGIYFVPGTYSASSVALVTNKKLQMDAATYFIAEIDCPTVDIIGDPSFPVADFHFTQNDVVAHSSWFRSAYAFLTCGADTLVFDATTNFAQSSTINSNITVSNKTIIGKNRLPLTYGTNGRVTYTSCNFVGEKFWNKDDKVTFTNTAIKDTWFAISGASNFDFVNNIIARGILVDRLDLINFQDTLVYVKALQANGTTAIDLAGRKVASVNLSGFTDIKNVYADSITISNGSGSDITLDNVHTGSISVGGRYLTIKNSEVSFYGAPSIAALWIENSRVFGGVTWTSSSMQIIATDSYIGFGLDYTNSNNTQDHAYIEFTNCTFQTNAMYSLKRLTMKRCVTNNNTIKIYPHKTDNVYYIGQVTIENSVLNNNNPIEFTKFDDDNCYDCMLQWTIIGNTFAGNTEGLRMRYWQNRTGNNWGKTFVAPVHQDITYSGNVGQCPDDTARGIVISSNDTGYTTVEFSEDYKGYKYSSAWKRMVCNRSSSTPSVLNTYMESGIKESGTLVKYYSWVNSPYDSLSYDLFIQSTWFLYPRSIDDPVNNGDWFSHAIIVMGDYLRIVQRGDGDHNRGIIGKVI